MVQEINKKNGCVGIQDLSGCVEKKFFASGYLLLVHTHSFSISQIMRICEKYGYTNSYGEFELAEYDFKTETVLIGLVMYDSIAPKELPKWNEL